MARRPRRDGRVCLVCASLPQCASIRALSILASLLPQGVVARTCTVWDTTEPIWPPYAPRAFTMPISHPCADVRVGVFDDDGSTALDEDDHLG